MNIYPSEIYFIMTTNFRFSWEEGKGKSGVFRRPDWDWDLAPPLWPSSSFTDEKNDFLCCKRVETNSFFCLFPPEDAVTVSFGFMFQKLVPSNLDLLFLSKRQKFCGTSVI